jgi:hypothetical protein
MLLHTLRLSTCTHAILDARTKDYTRYRVRGSNSPLSKRQKRPSGKVSWSLSILAHPNRLRKLPRLGPGPLHRRLAMVFLGWGQKRPPSGERLQTIAPRAAHCKPHRGRIRPTPTTLIQR